MKKKIQKFIDDRNVECCIHFTKVENLKSILQYGLLSKDEMDYKFLDYHYNDSLRLDGYTESISVSITFPNYKMLYKYRMENSSSRWVVLILDASLVLSLDCAFCFKNAASSSINSIAIEELKSYAALEDMFKENHIYTRKEMNLSENEPTNPQAEILVFQNIPVEAIKFVIFEDFSDMQTHKHKLDSMNIAYCRDYGYFGPRHDFKYW